MQQQPQLEAENGAGQICNKKGRRRRPFHRTYCYRLAIGNVHRYFEAETQVSKFRFGPHNHHPLRLGGRNHLLQDELCAEACSL